MLHLSYSQKKNSQHGVPLGLGCPSERRLAQGFGRRGSNRSDEKLLTVLLEVHSDSSAAALTPGLNAWAYVRGPVFGMCMSGVSRDANDKRARDATFGTRVSLDDPTHEPDSTWQPILFEGLYDRTDFPLKGTSRTPREMYLLLVRVTERPLTRYQSKTDSPDDHGLACDYGYVLQPVDKSPGCFKRVGYLSTGLNVPQSEARFLHYLQLPSALCHRNDISEHLYEKIG